MPHAVTHFLMPAILVAIFRDIYLRKNKKSKHKREFPLHYVLIAGLAGLIPDLDIAVFYIASSFGFTFSQIHRTFSHNLFVPLIFIVLGLIFLRTKNSELGKHKLKLSTSFFIISFSIFIHLLLDAIFSGKIIPFYPLANFSLGLNLLKLLPSQFQQTIEPAIDAAILIFWMIYIEVKHKISDFI